MTDSGAEPRDLEEGPVEPPVRRLSILHNGPWLASLVIDHTDTVTVETGPLAAMTALAQDLAHRHHLTLARPEVWERRVGQAVPLPAHPGAA